MTKKELIREMAKEASVSRSIAKMLLDSFIEVVVSELKKRDGKIVITGFGTFYKKTREARMIRDPRTGKEFKIGVRNYVKFRAGKALQESRADRLSRIVKDSLEYEI